MIKVLLGLLAAFAVTLAICAYFLIDANRTIGKQGLALAVSTQTAKDNEAVFKAVNKTQADRIATLEFERDATERAGAASLRRENTQQTMLVSLENKLREVSKRDDETLAWASTVVPTAIISGMHDAAAAALSRPNGGPSGDPEVKSPGDVIETLPGRTTAGGGSDEPLSVDAEHGALRDAGSLQSALRRNSRVDEQGGASEMKTIVTMRIDSKTRDGKQQTRLMLEEVRERQNPGDPPLITVQLVLTGGTVAKKVDDLVEFV